MIEYGVWWDETGEVQPVASQREAELIVALHSWDGYVVMRTVTYGEWTENSIIRPEATA